MATSFAVLELIILLEVIVLGGLAGYIHFRHAQANYPNSMRWQWALFLSGFTCGTTCLATILYQEASIYELFLFSLLGGIFLGLISRFLFPYNMKRIYPKRTDGAE